MTRLLYDKPTAAEQLSISVRTLETLLHDGVIGSVLINRRRLVAHDELVKYVDRLKAAA